MAILPTDYLLAISIYIQGEELDPDDVTRITGIRPSEIHRKGEPKIKGREKPIYRTSSWILSRDVRSHDVSAEISNLLLGWEQDGVAKACAKADTAFVDVFVAQTVDDDRLGMSIDFELDPAVISLLQKIGLKVKFSVCNVGRHAEESSS